MDGGDGGSRRSDFLRRVHVMIWVADLEVAALKVRVELRHSLLERSDAADNRATMCQKKVC